MSNERREEKKTVRQSDFYIGPLRPPLNLVPVIFYANSEFLFSDLN